MSFRSKVRSSLGGIRFSVGLSMATAFIGCSSENMPSNESSDLAGSEAADTATIGQVTQSATLAVPGFGDATLVSANGLDRAIAMTFAPDGRLFVSFQDGQIKIIKNIGTPSVQVITAGTIALCEVCNDNERGLLGLALDPNFPTESNLYAYYTVDSGGIRNRISRFSVTGDTVATNTPQTLVTFDVRTANIHNGGALHFGNDGKLYVASGVEDAGSQNGNRLAQELTNTFGKLLRFNKDGTIPTDNPFFAQTSGLNRAIFVRGLRNPFTFAFQRTSGRLFINDVGSDKFEEINEVPAGSTGGQNFQWPDDDLGAGSYHKYSHGANNENCSINGGTFYNPTTAQFPSAWAGRYFFGDWCNHQIRYIETTGASAATSTLFASNVAGAPNGSGGGVVDLVVGPEGALYYLARGNGGVIGRITNTQGTPPSIVQQPASVSVAPAQNAAFSVSAEGTAPLVYQWQRRSDSGGTNVLTNGDFAAQATDWATNLIAGNTASFAAGYADFNITAAGTNPWDSQLTHNISLTGATQYTLCYDVKTDEAARTIGVSTDGAADSNYPNRGLNRSGATAVNITTAWTSQAHTFTASATDATSRVVFNLGTNVNDVMISNVRLAAGSSCAGFANIAGATSSSYTLNNAALADNGALFRALVSNSAGEAKSTAATLTVLNDAPPTATITTPLLGATYVAGTTLSFSGSATDAEDGTLPASAFTWTVDLYHDNHAHPAMPATSGITSGTYDIPNTGHTETDVWVRVTLTVRDSSGLTDTKTVDVNPVLVNLAFASQPAGLTVTLNDQPFVAPFVEPSVAGVIRAIGAPTSQFANGSTWLFSGWAHGGAQNQSITTPLTDASFTAVFTECSNCASCSDGVMNQDETGIDCGGATCPACVVNMLTNGDFAAGATGWASGVGTVATVSYTNGYADFSVNAAPANPWTVELVQGVSLVNGTTYTLCYDIKTDESAREIEVALDNGPATYTNVATPTRVILSNTWTRRTTTFTANASADTTSRLQFKMGNTEPLAPTKNLNDVQIDNVFLGVGSTCGLPPVVGCTQAADCEDLNPCTTDSCVSGECAHLNNTNTCADDGDSCTNDVCAAGSCTHPSNDLCECVVAADCDDGNPCTTESCTGTPKLCGLTNNTNSCDDGNSNTCSDVCSAGTCAGTTCTPGAWVSTGINTITAAGWSEDTFPTVTTNKVRFCFEEADMIEVMEAEARNSGTKRALTLALNSGALTNVANLIDNSTTSSATVATAAGQYKCVEYNLASSTINSARVFSDFAGNWKLDRWTFEYWSDGGTPPATCSDAIKNGVETDVDCGGGTCAACTTGKTCTVASDCSTNLCSGTPLTCQAGGVPNLLGNGTFANGGVGWTGNVGAGGGVTYAAGMADFNIVTVSANDWDYELFQNVSVTNGTQYSLCFSVKTDEVGRNIGVVLDQGGTPNYTPIGVNATVPVTTAWVAQKITFTATATDTTARVQFKLGKNLNDVQLDNIGVFAGADCGSF